MKLIPLTHGYFAQVDDQDFESLNQSKWYPAKTRCGTVYAIRYGKNKKSEKMHHAILGRPPKGKRVDHKDGDGLNNQRFNLRFATHCQNAYNQRLRSDNKSGFKGVNFYPWWRGGMWLARIGVNKKRRCLGYFTTKEAAADAYREAAIKLHKEFACVA